MNKMPTNANMGHLKFTAEFTYYAPAKAEVVSVVQAGYAYAGCG